MAALQRALKAAGDDPGQLDGTFGAGTVAAMVAWQAANGLDQTGRLALASFVSYPPGATVDSVAVQVGDRVGQGGALAVLDPAGSLVATADVSQLDVGKLRVGQHARLTFDGLDGGTAAGTVQQIAASPVSSAASAGSTTVVQYAVTVAPTRLPAGARAGMTGQASVVVASRRDVVVVPSSAIGGSAAAPTVEVVADGVTSTRPVVVGLTTAAETEILTGVRAGEQVVTGIAPTASNTGPTVPQGGGRFPGGFFRAGGAG